MLRFWKKRDPLDDPLFHWPDGTPFTVRQMLRSVESKGITGSGKTSGTLQHYLECLAAHPRACIFMITQKPEDKAQVVGAFKRAGKPLVVIEPGGGYRCNFYQYMNEAGWDTRAMTEFNTVIGEGLQTTGGKREPFWQLSEERLIYNAISPLALVDTVTAPKLLDFISTALYDKTDLNDEWRAKSHNLTLRNAAQAKKTPAQANDWAVAKPFWTEEFPNMADKTRSSILAGVMNTISTANTGLAGVMTSTTNNITPAALNDGVSILVNMPFSELGPTARYVALGWKYIVQRYILKRQWDSRFFNVMVMDEYQEAMTEFDANYLAQCRSHGGCMLCLTQTANSEYSRMPEHKANMLLSNFATHICHLGDAKTETFISALLGHRKEAMPTIPGDGNLYEAFNGKSNISVNFQYTPVLQPGFLQGSGMRTGGPGNDYCVDALVVTPGRAFKSREVFSYVTFRQRRS